MTRAAIPVLLLAGLSAVPAVAERPRIEVTDGEDCPLVSARFVALLESDGGGVVLSAAPFPGSHAVDLSPDGRPLGILAGHPELLVSGVAGQVQVLRGSGLAAGARGCLGFDKDRFTWASDVLTYAQYLAGLLREAQRLDPDERILVSSDRAVRLEVRRPDGAFALLEGTEGSMMGFGKKTDEVRTFFLPVLLGPAGEDTLVNVLRNRGAAFAAGATESIAWVLLAGNEPATVPVEPPLEIRRVD